MITDHATGLFRTIATLSFSLASTVEQLLLSCCHQTTVPGLWSCRSGCAGHCGGCKCGM